MKKIFLGLTLLCSVTLFFSQCASSRGSTEAGETEMADELSEEQRDDTEEYEVNELP
jgi:hypothetical protein